MVQKGISVKNLLQDHTVGLRYKGGDVVQSLAVVPEGCVLAHVVAQPPPIADGFPHSHDVRLKQIGVFSHN